MGAAGICASERLVVAFTRGSAETLKLEQGKRVTVVIKSTEVMLATD
jgi:molybdopterin-binding protein